MDTIFFLKENREGWKEEEILLSERFQEDGAVKAWRIRPMSQRENQEIWKKSQKNQNRYETKVLAESVCYPDLKDAALQNSYGVLGAENLLLQMLTPGEFAQLRQAVEKINGGEA